MILAGLVMIGLWIVDSVGGNIRIGYLAVGLGLFVASYLVSIVF